MWPASQQEPLERHSLHINICMSPLLVTAAGCSGRPCWVPLFLSSTYSPISWCLTRAFPRLPVQSQEEVHDFSMASRAVISSTERKVWPSFPDPLFFFLSPFAIIIWFPLVPQCDRPLRIKEILLLPLTNELEPHAVIHSCHTCIER